MSEGLNTPRSQAPTREVQREPKNELDLSGGSAQRLIHYLRRLGTASPRC